MPFQQFPIQDIYFIFVQKLNMQCKDDTLNIVYYTFSKNYNEVKSRHISNAHAKDFFPSLYIY